MKVQLNQLYRATHWLGMIMLVMSAFVACEDINTPGAEGEGQMNFYLTDAPGDYEEVNIDVQAVKIRYIAESDSADTTQSDSTISEGQARWIDVPVEPFKINLLDYTDADTLIAETEGLEPGRYNELRLILGEDNEIVIDGETHKLTTPSAQESGYKIKFNTWLESGELMDLTIDFDAEKSIVKAGNSGKYLLKPVLQAFEGRTDSADE